MSESYFDSEDFKETLSRFLSRKREGVSFYMDSDDFINISDYYLEKGNMEEARGIRGSPLPEKRGLGLFGYDYPTSLSCHISLMSGALLAA